MSTTYVYFDSWFDSYSSRKLYVYTITLYIECFLIQSRRLRSKFFTWQILQFPNCKLGPTSSNCFLLYIILTPEPTQRSSLLSMFEFLKIFLMLQKFPQSIKKAQRISSPFNCAASYASHLLTHA